MSTSTIVEVGGLGWVVNEEVKAASEAESTGYLDELVMLSDSGAAGRLLTRMTGKRVYI